MDVSQTLNCAWYKHKRPRLIKVPIVLETLEEHLSRQKTSGKVTQQKWDQG